MVFKLQNPFKPKILCVQVHTLTYTRDNHRKSDFWPCKWQLDESASNVFSSWRMLIYFEVKDTHKNCVFINSNDSQKTKFQITYFFKSYTFLIFVQNSCWDSPTEILTLTICDDLVWEPQQIGVFLGLLQVIL